MAEVLNVTPEVTPESPEYVAEMAAKGEAAVNNGATHGEAPAVPAKPEGIPDKFYNADTGEVDYAALAKSYTELEKKASSKVPVETPEAKPEDKPEGTSQEAAEEAVEKAGLDFAGLTKEYADNGEISAESYAKLEKAGIPRETVDDYIEGRLAAASVARTQAFAITDGEDSYKAMVQWASANMSPEDISAYNKAVNSKNASERELAVRGMWSRYGAESGSESNLVQGSTKSVSSGGGYESRQQLIDAMGDPRYKTDPAYRKSVTDKLAKSNIF